MMTIKVGGIKKIGKNTIISYINTPNGIDNGVAADPQIVPQLTVLIPVY